jgi:phosphohistidine phosphatase
VRLYILRHAQAGDRVEGLADNARQLTALGVERMRDAAAGMQRLGLKFDAILTSPLPRANETAAIVAAVYDNRPSPELLEALAVGVPPGEAVDALKPFARPDHLMIVGHEPQLSEIASILLTGAADRLRSDLKKGGCIAIEFPSRVAPGTGKLLWMLTQRQLRKLRK